MKARASQTLETSERLVNVHTHIPIRTNKYKQTKQMCFRLFLFYFLILLITFYFLFTPGTVLRKATVFHTLHRKLRMASMVVDKVSVVIIFEDIFQCAFIVTRCLHTALVNFVYICSWRICANRVTTVSL